MLEVLLNWYRRRFSDPNAVTLFWLLIGGFAVIYFYNDILAPVLVAMVIAYLLEWFIQRLLRIGLGRNISTTIVMLFFIGVMLLIGIGILPVVFRQGITLIKEAPAMLSHATNLMKELPERYPELVDITLIESLIALMQERILNNSAVLVSVSFSSLMNLAVIVVYTVLVPILIFFMLKDKEHLLITMKRFLPDNRTLVNRVWLEMNEQISNYIRGKVIHILIVGSVSYIVFALMGLNYTLLLGVLVGFSVLIPYVGAFAVTIPVIVVALFQWGIRPETLYVLGAYIIIQVLDGNVLTPLLFSEAMNLHPIAIILAVLVFGGLWGFWGVFFAIPLATLVKVVINSWPGSSRESTSIGSY
ncbi:MAG: AI-2E family transporter [Gammaproteobacteria bacterium]|uniref:Putative permease n=1 Tax=Tolumonas osonensis TaxID=675874 RepID=A0A841GPA7_9GAMM|nr:AI-2E family transporter [Tolumonas osonensis]MBB6056322.1 putative permease [Tolumonas osonensis]NCB60008.1 AI-2E family transporter [Gammaproteobacteria bacterium]